MQNARLSGTPPDRSAASDNEPEGGVIGDVSPSKQATKVHPSNGGIRLAKGDWPDGFMILHAVREENGRIVDFVYQYANSAAARTTGRPVADLVDRRLLDISFGSVEAAKVLKRYVHVMESGDADDVEVYDASEGIERWFRRIAIPLGDSLVLKFSDITAQMRAERRREFLADAARALSESLEAEDLLERLTALSVRHFADCAITYLKEKGGWMPRIGAAHADSSRQEALLELERRIAPELVSHRLRSDMDRGEVVSQLDIDEQTIDSWSKKGALGLALRQLTPRSAVAAPISGRDRTYGALVVATLRNRHLPFDAEDVETVKKVARLVGMSIDAGFVRKERDARSEAENRTHEERALLQATAAILATASVEKAIEEIPENALVAVRADGAVVERIHDANESVRIVASTGARRIPSGSDLQYSGSLVAHVVQSGRRELIPRLSDAEVGVSAELLGSCSECSVLAVPLAEGDQPFGALLLLREPRRPLFEEDEIDRATVFANLASLAFRRVHLLEQAERGREELRDATELRRRLVRGFSHDLKNPLGAARGYLDLLEMDLLGDLNRKQEETVGRVRAAVDETLRLVHEIVELAQPEAGHVVLDAESMRVSAVLDQVVSLYRGQARTAQLALEASVPDELPAIRSDSVRVRQILGNLLSNAIKYTPPGGTIDIVAVGPVTHERDHGRWIAIAVRDTGAGIPLERHTVLFQEAGRGKVGGTGSGIGLAISQRLARALGGEITVESQVGEGSTFTLWLPLDGGRKTEGSGLWTDPDQEGSGQ